MSVFECPRWLLLYHEFVVRFFHEIEMSKSDYGSKNSKQTDADGDWQGVPGVREMTEIKQQNHSDVFYHKQYVREHHPSFYM